MCKYSFQIFCVTRSAFIGGQISLWPGHATSTGGRVHAIKHRSNKICPEEMTYFTCVIRLRRWLYLTASIQNAVRFEYYFMGIECIQKIIAFVNIRRVNWMIIINGNLTRYVV